MKLASPQVWSIYVCGIVRGERGGVEGERTRKKDQGGREIRKGGGEWV